MKVAPGMDYAIDFQLAAGKRNVQAQGYEAAAALRGNVETRQDV
jgi:hypothetical protein